MTLASLSPETMAEIAEYIPSSKVLLLWLSGDRILMLKLWKIQSIDLRDPVRHSSSRFPKFLPTLKHLRKLSISRPYGPLGWASFPAELAKMDSLVSLSLETSQKDMEKLFESLPKPLKEIWPNLEILSVSGANPFNSRWPNASQFPDGLATLGIASYDFESITSLGIFPRKLSALSLKCLGAAYKTSSIKLDDAPPSLVSLSLEVRLERQDSLKVLPKSITHMEYLMPEDYQTLVRSEYLPPNLTSLTFSPCVTVNCKPTFAFLKSLRDLTLRYSTQRPRPASSLSNYDEHFCPYQLEELTIHVPELASTSLMLPPKLRKLDLWRTLTRDVSVWHTDGTFPIKPVPGLPPSVRHLKTELAELHFDEEQVPLADDFEGFALWTNPTNQHVYILEESKAIPIPQRPVVNVGLRALERRNWLENSTLLGSNLSKLTKLVILDSKLQGTSHSGATVWTYLPHTLTHLQIKLATPILRFDDFPPELRHLELSCPIPTQIGTSPAQIFRRPEWMNLTKLVHLETLKLLYPGLEFEGIANPDFALLPDCLRTLELSGHMPLQVTGECFAYLPRYLTALDMQLLGLQDRHFALLPRSIHRLYLPLTSDLTPAIYQLGPPGVLDTSRKGLAKLLKIVDNVESEEFGFAIDPRVYTNPFLGESPRAHHTDRIDLGGIVAPRAAPSGSGESSVWGKLKNFLFGSSSS